MASNDDIHLASIAENPLDLGPAAQTVLSSMTSFIQVSNEIVVSRNFWVDRAAAKTTVAHCTWMTSKGT